MGKHEKKYHCINNIGPMFRFRIPKLCFGHTLIQCRRTNNEVTYFFDNHLVALNLNVKWNSDIHISVVAMDSNLFSIPFKD